MIQLKMGLEKEFFVKEGDELILVPFNLPSDDCGWLVEARGEPSLSIFQAVFSLRAEEARIKSILSKKDAVGAIQLDDSPIQKVDKKLRIAAGRIYTKGLVQYQNLYGYIDHKTKADESTAGVHLSFTRPQSRFISGSDKEFFYNGNFDWPYIFTELDRAFTDEIKEAKRRPGFYEVKHDGRVEYRSLPANVNLDKVITVVSEILEDMKV